MKNKDVGDALLTAHDQLFNIVSQMDSKDPNWAIVEEIGSCLQSVAKVQLHLIEIECNE